MSSMRSVRWLAVIAGLSVEDEVAGLGSAALGRADGHADQPEAGADPGREEVVGDRDLDRVAEGRGVRSVASSRTRIIGTATGTRVCARSAVAWVSSTAASVIEL